jgi:hypothetical protein
MALVAGSAAFGQALKPYRLHVLKDSAGADFVVHGVESILVPNPDGNAIAINDKGVVGATFETGASTGIYHGFVWFPNTLGLSNFAFPTREVIDIHPYAFPGGTIDSTIVNDVADDDALIGFRGATPGADGHAYLFPMTVTLPTPTIGAVDLHTTTGDYSIGFGVRESSPLQIVGLTTVACEDKSELHPFVTTWSSGGGAGSMQLLPIPATEASGSASDIARTGSFFLVSAADFNGDLRVDATDRADLFANYCSSGCSAAQLEFDLNCDGVVDAADMALLGGTYWSGSGLAPVPTVCECSQPVPMSSALLDEETALTALGFARWLEFGIWLGDAEPAQADAACDMLAALLRESLD